MEPEWEAVLRAYDAAREALANDIIARRAAFDRLFNELAADHPKVSRETLLNVVRFAHRKWVLAQSRPPTMPPRA